MFKRYAQEAFLENKMMPCTIGTKWQGKMQ